MVSTPSSMRSTPSSLASTLHPSQPANQPASQSDSPSFQPGSQPGKHLSWPGLSPLLRWQAPLLESDVGTNTRTHKKTQNVQASPAQGHTFVQALLLNPNMCPKSKHLSQVQAPVLHPSTSPKSTVQSTPCHASYAIRWQSCSWLEFGQLFPNLYLHSAALFRAESATSLGIHCTL